MYDDKFYSKLTRCIPWQSHVGYEVTNMFKIGSVVDMGCGVAGYLLGCLNAGANVRGLEYSYDACRKYIPEPVAKFVSFADLTTKIQLWKYELAISCEIGEHLPEDKSDIYVDNLTNSSNSIMFSAAIPGQKGVGHICLKEPQFWIDKFEARGFMYNIEKTEAIKNIYRTMPYRSPYTRVMTRNIKFFNRRIQ